MENKNKYSKIAILIIAIIITCLYSLGMLVVFHNYITDRQFSDFTPHIQAAIDGTGYSLAHVVMRLCCYTTFGDKLLSLVMVAVLLLTAFSVSLFVKKYLLGESEHSWIVAWLIGLSATAITQIFIPIFWPHTYVHETLMAPNWHNATFLFMRLFGWITLFVYFELRNRYMEKGNWKDYILFTICLIMVNLSKPNFILSFAPMMLLVLIFDFIKYRGKNFLYVVRFGICVLISLSVVLVQTSKVYGDGSSIIFKFDDIVAMISNPSVLLWSLFSNIALPIFVTVLVVVSKNDNSRRDILAQSWIMFIISAAQKIFMDESGERMGHGNYAWGCYFFCQVLNVVAFVELIRLIKSKSISKISAILGSLLFLAEVASGIYYFVHILGGGYYIL